MPNASSSHCGQSWLTERQDAGACADRRGERRRVTWIVHGAPQPGGASPVPDHPRTRETSRSPFTPMTAPARPRDMTATGWRGHGGGGRLARRGYHAIASLVDEAICSSRLTSLRTRSQDGSARRHHLRPDVAAAVRGQRLGVRRASRRSTPDESSSTRRYRRRCPALPRRRHRPRAGPSRRGMRRGPCHRGVAVGS
jgi:hypothetical protein